jgi:hypothetical protein
LFALGLCNDLDRSIISSIEIKRKKLRDKRREKQTWYLNNCTEFKEDKISKKFFKFINKTIADTP